ncbi:secretin N-terminal domain-containing protein [Candidatus Omnitrophota bacterium]
MRKYFFKKICTTLILTYISSLAFAQLPVSDNLAPISNNKKITLELKGMDIVEVLKTLASKGDLNLVIGSNVRGRVTMFLEDVDIKDAFEIMLVANNLASDQRGDIIYIMTQTDYEQLYGEKYGDKREIRMLHLKYAKAPEVAKVLSQIKTSIGKVIVDEGSNTIIVMDIPRAISRIDDLMDNIDKPTKTVVFELNYAKAEDLKDRIQEMLTTGVGALQIDARTNKIIVTDLEDSLDKIKRVINAFDDKLQQVLIEAKIIEITLDDRHKLGVDWEALIKAQKDINLQSSFKLASQGALTPGSELVVGTFGSGDDYAVMVQALKTIGDTNVLSSPRITVLDNEEAKILVGSNEPYATNTVTQGTSTTTTATSLTFLDVGVKLYVTPAINKDGFVSIKIRPEVSSKSGNYTYGTPATTVPIVSTTHAETNVSIKDGATIIIAGLIKDERSGTVSKIPILGDIPILGHVFKKTDNQIIKKELVIFLTPHIISGETDYLEQPLSPPLGEMKFTMPESPTFERRRPREMSPGYFRGEAKRREGKVREYDIDEASSASEEYYRTIKDKIVQNLSITEEDKKLLESGDKVTVSFFLYSSGKLAGVPKILESTNGLFSYVIIDAVNESAPFPPFSRSIKESKKEFTLDLVYQP